MAACTNERVRKSGGCGTGTRTVSARRESTLTEDWGEAQKCLRERLQARDNNTLPALRRGQDLTFGEWADFYLENFSRPPFRAQKTHEVNQRALKHLREHVREHQTRGTDRRRYRDVSSSAAQAACAGESKERIRGEGGTEGNDSTSGIASVASHVECGGAQEVSLLRIHAQASSFRRGSMDSSGRIT